LNFLRGSDRSVLTVRPIIKITLFLVIFWTLGVTVARAVRLPNTYAKCHWLFDYRFGFMKRGLIGAISNNVAAIFGKTVTSELISILSGIAFGLFMLALVVIIINLLQKSDYNINMLIVIAVFVSAPFIVMSAHVFGYFDNILYLILIFSLYLVEKKLFLSAAVISSAAVLIHESYLLTGLPLLYFAVFMKCCSEDKEKKPSIGDMIFMLLPVAVFVFLFVYGAMVKNSDLNNKLYHYLNSFDYISTGRRKGVAHWQTISFVELFKTQSRFFISRLVQLDAAAVFLPSLLVLLNFIYTSFKIKVLSFKSIFIQAVIFAPLMMHIIAFDTIRLSLNSIVVGFILIWVLARNIPFSKFDPQIMIMAFPVLILNFFIRVPLMDNCVDGFTDFQRLLFYLPVFIFLILMISGRIGGERFRNS